MSLTELYETLKDSGHFDEITKNDVECQMEDLARRLNQVEHSKLTRSVSCGSETYYFDPWVFSVNENIGDESKSKQQEEEMNLFLPMKIAHFEIHHEDVRCVVFLCC